LALIASAKTSRSAIESILEKNIGGYLDRLENEYTIIRKIRPVTAKQGSRVMKYEIIDNFFNFWFRFIFKYRSAIEIENYAYVKEIVRRDYATYSGRFLEKFFIEKLKQSCEYSSIGSYWERGNQNEIDIVAVNDAEKRVLIAEVKRNPQKIDRVKLQNKAKKLIAGFKKYEIQYAGFSLQDM
jgi:AAA+ ATPase superfamily predicted ATPase